MLNRICKLIRYLKISEYLKALFHLFYPHICLQCGTDVLEDQYVICKHCESQLPFTNFSQIQNSPVEKIFWGRVKIQTVVSILFFTKESIVQKIVFELKYKQNKKAGYLLGKLIANELIYSNKHKHIDYLIPIPISRKRLRGRGFNQAQVICESIIAHGYNIPIFKGLVKLKDTPTQTHKDRKNRGNQTNSFFFLNDFENLTNKHLLIIDDVLTTGATLEAASYILSQSNPASIHIATAAYTLH